MRWGVGPWGLGLLRGVFTDNTPPPLYHPFSSVRFRSRWYLCARKSPYALHSVSRKFPQRPLWNSSNVRLTEDGPFVSFQRRSSTASSVHASLLQAMICVVYPLRALIRQNINSSSVHARDTFGTILPPCGVPLSMVAYAGWPPEHWVGESYHSMNN